MVTELYIPTNIYDIDVCMAMNLYFMTYLRQPVRFYSSIRLILSDLCTQIKKHCFDEKKVPYFVFIAPCAKKKIVVDKYLLVA